MSDSSIPGFGKFVPGYDFLQNIAKGASGGIPQMPNLGNWVAPTLNVEELDKRIQELKAVHFWLEQNARALGATVQALEVQKMTLATLKGMNFNLGDVTNALKLKAADSVASSLQAMTPATSEPSPTKSASASAKPRRTRAAKPDAKRPAAASATQPVVDPLQLWSALTQQFGQIATNAMKDAGRAAALDLTKSVATGLAKEAVTATKNVATRAVRTGVATLSSSKAKKR